MGRKVRKLGRGEKEGCKKKGEDHKKRCVMT